MIPIAVSERAAAFLSSATRTLDRKRTIVKTMLTGGQIVAQTLHELGAETIFSVSGNQILPIFDAAADAGIRIIHMRHESAAAYAAAACAEVCCERPSVVLVSAGPGYLAALTGVATAKSMEVPLLLLSGASATSEAGAGGFQDLDQCGIARATCKATMNVSSVHQIPEALASAWRLAQAAVPGPVHVNLSADALMAGSAERPRAQNHQPVVAVTHDTSVLEAMALRLMKAKRPLIIARPSANRGMTGEALLRLALQLGIKPVITESPRGLSDPKYLEVARQYRNSDCALAVCPADFAVGFLAQTVIADSGSLLQIDAPGDPQRQRVPDLHSQIPAHAALPYLAKATAHHQPCLGPWSDLWSFSEETETPLGSSAAGLHPLEVAKRVRDVLRPSDVVIMDGGEFCQWIRLGLRGITNRILWNSKLGGIGGSIPLAIGAAASGHSDRTICFLGDGAFGYHASEFETATRYHLSFVAIVGNDARWAAEWHMQAARYGPERTFETSLSPARYDLVSSGLGGIGFQIEDSASLRDALAASLSSDRPACLNVKIQSLRSPAPAHVAV